eukprot:TRINITY_DN13502_c0_g1_i2.p1 TRINITY_DN13502_c0_g1~~TRINITY_DN13502_c0_g1_i2.p1  ORF type:complete len:291 (+),score=118.04 TRINITY_DN13502_c0_g1_i2:42-914(+)
MLTSTLSRPPAEAGTRGMRRTFVGNWSEDIQAREDEMSEYLKGRTEGKLLSQQIKGKKRVHTAPVHLSEVHADGHLRVGQLVCLQNGATEGVLSVDLDDILTQRPHQKLAVSTAPAKDPLYRNTWLCHPLPHPDDAFWEEKGEGDLIHYGQKFRLALNPDLVEATPGMKQLYLHSEMLTPSCHSKVTHQQEVSICDHGTSAITWEFLYANPEFRFEMVGQPVKCNAVVVLSHCPTGQYLASHKKTQLNDFGPEFECFAHKCYAIRGKNNEVRPEAPQNHWVAVTGISPDE